MSKGVSDLLIACTQSERDRAEYNAKLPPEEATMSDEGAEFLDRKIAEMVDAEQRPLIEASGLSPFGWLISRDANRIHNDGRTEARTEEILRSFEDALTLGCVCGRCYGACNKATLSDINKAIEEIKQAGLWPWKQSTIM